MPLPPGVSALLLKKCRVAEQRVGSEPFLVNYSVFALQRQGTVQQDTRHRWRPILVIGTDFAHPDAAAAGRVRPDTDAARRGAPGCCAAVGHAVEPVAVPAGSSQGGVGVELGHDVHGVPAGGSPREPGGTPTGDAATP